MPNASVFPFILRGANLLGIDSVMCPQPRRKYIWERLAKDLPLEKLQALTHFVGLGDVPEVADKIIKGQIAGRVVVDIRK